MSASRIKLEWRRLRYATPLKTKYCLYRGFFVLSAQTGAVYTEKGDFSAYFTPGTIDFPAHFSYNLYYKV